MAVTSLFPFLRHLVTEHRPLAILLLIALILNVYLITAFPVQKIWGDEGEYIRLSHREQSFGAKVKRIVPGFMYFEWWPPFAFGVYGLLAGPEPPPASIESLDVSLLPIGQYGSFFSRVALLNLILFLITAFNIYRLCNLLELGRKTAAVATGLFLFNPRILFYIQALWPEFLHLAMLSWGLVLLVQHDLQRRHLFLILAGVLFGFCSLTKGIVGIYLVALFPILGYRAYTRSRKNIFTVLKILAIFYGCFLAVNLPQRISNYATHKTLSISTNRWINIELGFMPYLEFKVDQHKRYFESSQDPRIREELSKRRVIDYIKSSNKVKLVANQINRFVFKQLNRSFLGMGYETERWQLTPTFGYLSVIMINLAVFLSWSVFLFSICGFILQRSPSFRSSIISLYVILYLLLTFFIVHNSRFFIQALPFLGIFAASFLMSVKWRAVKNKNAE
jgi:hypothetical protein